MNNTVIVNSAWDTLSLPEKAEMMKVAVRNGIYKLKDIQDKYNKFAGGGSKKKVVHSINNDATQQAMQYFMGKGLTDYQAAGLVGNLFRESRLNPTAVNSGSGAYGIAQWLGSRKKNLFAKYGNNPSLSQQLDYVWHELNNTHKTGLNKLMSSRDSAEAARNAMGYYEFSAGPDAAIREMRRWGQNGERSMQEGINFASQLSGQPIVPYRTENHQLETVPFTPSNPEVFFGNPAAVYVSPAVEVEQPILKAAEDYAYNEQQERKDNLERFNMFMSMLNPSSNNDGFTDTVGLLSFGNRFDAGGPKKPVTKNDLRRMLQRNRAEAEAVYNSSIAETQTVPNDNVWVDRPLTRRNKNPHTERRAVEGAKADAAWRQEHPVATAIGAGLSAAPLAIAATPAVVGGGELGTAVLANPYVDAGLTSAFAGHGLNKFVNGEIENTADAVMTALELAPLGRLAKPIANETINAGKLAYNERYIPWKISSTMNRSLDSNPIIRTYASNPKYKDIGTLLDYQDYIQSIFPNSTIRNVVYHTTYSKPFEQFDPNKIKRGFGFYFSPSEHSLPFGRNVYAKVNIKNPLEINKNTNPTLSVDGLSGFGTGASKRVLATRNALNSGKYDGIIGITNMRNPGEPEIVALNPEQIHILGSNSDLAGFRRASSALSPKVTAENNAYRAAYPNIRYDIPNSDIIIESSTSANPNIPFY